MRLCGAWIGIYCFLCSKHIAHLVACSGPPLVHDGPLGSRICETRLLHIAGRTGILLTYYPTLCSMKDRVPSNAFNHQIFLNVVNIHHAIQYYSLLQLNENSGLQRVAFPKQFACVVIFEYPIWICIWLLYKQWKGNIIYTLHFTKYKFVQTFHNSWHIWRMVVYRYCWSVL